MGLVGRGREQAALRELVDRASGGHGRLAVIAGESGIGKTALLTDVLAYARGRQAVVLSGRAVADGAAYRPLAEALMPVVRAGRVRDSVELGPFRGALGRVLPGWAPSAPPEPGIDPVLLLGEGVLRLLLTLEAPVRVLVIENIEYADPDTVAVLEYLASAVADLPVLLVVTQADGPRSPSVERLLATIEVTRLRLPRLNDSALAELVDQIRPLPAEVRAAVIERAEGLPLVAAELAAAVPTDPRLVDTYLPPSFTDLVRARLNRLSADEHGLLAAAAVLGAPPYWPLVPALAGLDETAATAGLARAVELGLVVAELGTLRWQHGLVRETVWASLLPLEQARLNRRAADLLLRLDTEQTDAAAADRLVQAGEGDRAAEVLIRLARRALARGGLRGAEDLLRRAAPLGRPAEVAVHQVELLTVSGRPSDALQVGAAALDVITGDDHAELCLRLARAAVAIGHWAQAEQLVARAGRSDDPRSAILRADAAHGAGRVGDAAQLAATGVEHAGSPARRPSSARRCVCGGGSSG